VSFARDPHAFMFNNVYYHALQAATFPGIRSRAVLALLPDSVGDTF